MMSTPTQGVIASSTQIATWVAVAIIFQHWVAWVVVILWVALLGYCIHWAMSRVDGRSFDSGA